MILKESDRPPLVELEDALNQWFESGLGQQLLEREREVLERLMPRLHGYHLLQVSAVESVDFTAQAAASHCFKLVSRIALGMSDAVIVGEMENLPIASECVDAVVLHHALDFACSPHQALREAVRILRPGGRLVVVGFNPVSFWGLWRLWFKRPKRPKQVPWLGRFMTYRRLHDWLRLLEMKSDRVESGFYRPPLQSARWMQRLRVFERWGEKSPSINGAFWVVTATKETYASTPVGRSWRRRFAFPVRAAGVSRNSQEPVGNGGSVAKAASAAAVSPVRHKE
ncbi:MAG: SAM-dependent methyltransferase [Motiliproteus sp.]|jgi:SAM-dependent methyltransferase